MCTTCLHTPDIWSSSSSVIGRAHNVPIELTNTSALPRLLLSSFLFLILHPPHTQIAMHTDLHGGQTYWHSRCWSAHRRAPASPPVLQPAPLAPSAPAVESCAPCSPCLEDGDLYSEDDLFSPAAPKSKRPCHRPSVLQLEATPLSTMEEEEEEVTSDSADESEVTSDCSAESLFKWQVR